jgi:endonuclease/exonuclease/phosphatase family metal-dependent hydrolase
MIYGRPVPPGIEKSLTRQACWLKSSSASSIESVDERHTRLGVPRAGLIPPPAGNLIYWNTRSASCADIAFETKPRIWQPLPSAPLAPGSGMPILVTRRLFCTAVGAGLAASTSRWADYPKRRPLRVIAYNVFGGTGWPYQRRLAQETVAKGQMPKRLAMELALHDPDIVNFSESPAEEMTLEVAELLGMNHVRFPSGGKWPGTLLSRFEIAESKNVPLNGERPKELFTRHWGRATLKLPDGEPLIVHSAHLFPGADRAIRLREIQAIIAAMRPDVNANRSVLLLGDLNHGPDTPEYKQWLDAGLVDTFAKVGQGKGLTITSDIPKSRIDYILARGPIASHVQESRPLFEGAFRLHINDKQSFALSDHLPLLTVFEQ